MKKDSTFLSTINKNSILEFLRINGPSSRADLARKLNLSFPAVSSNVKALLDMDLIHEGGEGNNVLGRKSTFLIFNANRFYLIGVDMGRSHIRTMCSNIAGEIKYYKSIKSGKGDIFHAILSQIKTAAVEAGIAMESVICIGIGIPGIYDEKTHAHLLAPFLDDLETKDLFPRLKNSFTDKIMFFENSVNLGAVGERWKGCAQDYDNVVYMEFAVGIGAAILHKGKILYGANGAAGEIGYMAMESSILRSKFENEGALEKLIPSRLIRQYIDERIKEGETDLGIIMDDIQKEYHSCGIEQLLKYFAMAIINTAAVINPEIVVISGRLGTAIFSLYEKEINHLVVSHIPFPPLITCSILEEKGNVLGAIALAQEYAIRDYINLASN